MIDTFSASVVAVASAIALYYAAIGRFSRKKNLIGPKVTPFYGNYKDFKNVGFQLHLLLDKYYNEISAKTFSFFHCNKEVIVLKDAAMIDQVFKKNSDKFKNRKYFIELPSPCEHMITIIDGGKRHEFIRYLLSSLSSTLSLKKLSPHVIKAANHLCEKLDEAAKTKKPIDIESHSQGFKSELLAKISFSLDCENQSDLNKTLVKLMKDFTNPPSSLYGIASIPFGGTYLKLFDRTFQNLLQPFISIATKIVAERKLTPNNNQFEDILQTLLNTMSTSEKGRNLLTEEIILAQGLVVLTAVQGQTSFTLATTFYNIAKYPHVQMKLHKLIDNFKDEENFPTWEHLNDPSLVYLDNVIKETQRLYPSIFMLMRECTSPCNINGMKFNKGDSVLVPTMSIHKDEEYWNEPNVFDPDRFERDRNPKNYYPFGVGARNCAGYKLALTEIKTVLMMVLSRYELELANPVDDIQMASNVTIQANMTITSPLQINVKCRQK